MPISPPPSRIYLLRHAKSAPAASGQRDFDRELDDQGFAEAELVAEQAAGRRFVPDILISSTATRCRQTTDAIRRAVGETIEPLFVDDLYNGKLDTYLAVIASQGEPASVMLVGHNPVIGQMLAALVGEAHAAQALPGGFPTAALAVLDHDASGGDASWTLAEIIRP